MTNITKTEYEVDLINTKRETEAYQKLAEGFATLGGLPEHTEGQKAMFLSRARSYNYKANQCRVFLERLENIDLSKLPMDERKPFDVIFLEWEQDAVDGPYHYQGDGYDDVTWCHDRISDSDVEYLLATSLRKTAPDMREFIRWVADSRDVMGSDPGYLLRKIQEKAREHIRKVDCR